MLASRTLFSRDGVTIDDVACRHRAGRGPEVELATRHALVFVRRGCFVRRAGGSTELLDATVAYCAHPGLEQRYDHPDDAGDDCTAVAFDAATAAALWGGEERLPAGAIPIPPQIDLAHRRLLAAARRHADPEALYEHAIDLATRTLEHHDPRRLLAGRPSTRRARRRLVSDAREALATDAGRSLPELAGELGVSAHHLSRVFHAHTGHTISRYRLLLRGRIALERIAGGERNLARLAAELGFSDQSHLCRVLRAQTGHTPTGLRKLLA